MKKLNLILGLILAITINAYSQNLPISTNEVLYNDILRMSVEVEISPSPKAVKKAWKDFIQDRYDTRVSGLGLFSNKDILIAEDALIPIILDSPIQLDAKIVASNKVTKMNVFASSTAIGHLDVQETPEAFNGINRLVTSFLSTFLPQHYSEVVETSEDEVTDIAKDIEDLKDKIERNSKKIEDLKKENISLHAEVKTTQIALEKAKLELKADKRKFEKTKDKVKGQNK